MLEVKRQGIAEEVITNIQAYLTDVQRDIAGSIHIELNWHKKIGEEINQQAERIVENELDLPANKLKANNVNIHKDKFRIEKLLSELQLLEKITDEIPQAIYQQKSAEIKNSSQALQNYLATHQQVEEILDLSQKAIVSKQITQLEEAEKKLSSLLEEENQEKKKNKIQELEKQIKEYQETLIRFSEQLDQKETQHKETQTTEEENQQVAQSGSEKEIEIELVKLELINDSKELPFEIKDEVNINEDTRYRYRYLDLRRPISKNLLLVKDKFCHELRNFLHKKDFVDVETPILAQSSPEGANCFLVPSSIKERYYTLPQSPQIFKQLLMVGGFNKYYQIAKSFRNEDARSNRQIEFSQLDLEMSFATAKEIMSLTEKLLKHVLKKTFNHEIKTPFPSLTYQESKKYESFRHPFTIPQKKYIKPLLNNKIDPERVIGEAFDLVCNGEEILSGSIRIHQAELQEKVLEILGYNKEAREKNFGYFLRALEFAAPPHGGIGLGIDRLLTVILNTNNLKELIAFPKNIDGTCSLTGAPNLLN
ncbi:5254_t:CDS:2 [Ambispora gerdemannii]|uniref:5254_t:CDS:1 n=1 Tax=Ambispora gerdemannii TaxID=144530 RepID=A0A9N9CMM4_9GLOM|nr:5254_t:CDS:2 [Ambispora gerdemannii]